MDRLTTKDLLSRLISFRSLTPDDDGALDFIADYLDDFEAIRIDVGGVKNLLLHKKYGNGIHVAFAGHIDVVPAGEGWESDPFDADIRDGYMYGRGASDMKSGLAAFLNSAKTATDFDGTISLLITSDEEGDAIHGTVEILEYMKAHNMLPSVCIVAEPTCENELGDTIKVGRRGSINGKITIVGRGGHVAYPQKAINPISLTSAFVSMIADKKLDNGDEFFAPSQLVITDIRSGYQKTNVIPTELSLMFNVRNSTNTIMSNVENFVRKCALECGISNYELKIDQGSESFVASTEGFAKEAIDILSDIIKATTGKAPALSTSGGTSDARFVAKYGINVMEFGPSNETIHAPNERVLVDDLDKLESIFSGFISKIAKI